MLSYKYPIWVVAVYWMGFMYYAGRILWCISRTVFSLIWEGSQLDPEDCDSMGDAFRIVFLYMLLCTTAPVIAIIYGILWPVVWSLEIVKEKKGDRE